MKNNKMEVMMNYLKGDLLWIPQAAMLYRGKETLSSPMAVKFNEKPKIALFLENTPYDGYASINIEGDTWIVEKKQIKRLRTKEEQC